MIVFVIVLFLSLAFSETALIYNNYLISLTQGALVQEYTAAIARKSMGRIQDIKGKIENSDDVNFMNFSFETEEKMDRVIREIVNQFPDTRTMQEYEDIYFLLFLDDAFSKERQFGFTARDQIEEFKEKIKNSLNEFFPKDILWNKNRYDKTPLRFSQVIKNTNNPDRRQWVVTPSLRNILEVARGVPSQKRYFLVLLFSEIYSGNNKEKARKVWQGIRRIESSAIGQDSLGMFPDSIF
ncbi:hypothetical protein FACS1894187_19930 [Synergistales bacterium]|nr:hypothetical protein FACS1894187_19930 [Synergistales bacterium]